MSTRDVRKRVLPVAVLLLPLTGAVAAPTMQDNPSEVHARHEIDAQIEELGITLRAAVMSGTLAEQEAKEVYAHVVRVAKTAYVRRFGEEEQKAEQRPSAKGNVARLFAVRPGQIRLLLQPEYFRRDLQRLRQALDLDSSQTAVIDVLLDDYLAAYELAVTPLREALTRYRRVTVDALFRDALREADATLLAALEQVQRADRGAAVVNILDSIARIEEEGADRLKAASEDDRRRFKDWTNQMITATAELDERLAGIRQRTTEQLAQMSDVDREITADDLVRMATELRVERRQLGTELALSIEMILTDDQRGIDGAGYDVAMARVMIGHLLPQGRFGGESMDLWAALEEVAREHDLDGGLGRIDGLLNDREPDLATVLVARTRATLEREIAGLEFQAARDEIATRDRLSIFEVGAGQLDSAIRPYAAAAQREIDGSIAVRDVILSLLEESAASIEAMYPETDLSAAYRSAALRRAFPVEMRVRWSERALAAAIKLEPLGETRHETIETLRTQTATELAAVRDAAIRKRIARDPELARDFIDAEFAGVKPELDDDVWREIDYRAFASIDDRTETQLRSVLALEQFDQLPARRRAERGKKDPGKARVEQ